MCGGSCGTKTLAVLLVVLFPAMPVRPDTQSLPVNILSVFVIYNPGGRSFSLSRSQWNSSAAFPRQSWKSSREGEETPVPTPLRGSESAATAGSVQGAEVVPARGNPGSSDDSGLTKLSPGRHCTEGPLTHTLGLVPLSFVPSLKPLNICSSDWFLNLLSRFSETHFLNVPRARNTSVSSQRKNSTAPAPFS